MTRGGRYYGGLKWRRRSQRAQWSQIKAAIKSTFWLAFMLILGTLVWQESAKLDALQQDLDKIKSNVHKLQERFNEVDPIRRQIQDLQPNISDGEALETAAAILSSCKKYKADPTIILAMANAESSFGREEIGGVGERGILQVRPETFQDWGYGDFTDWRATLEAGIRYYKWLERRYSGNVTLTISAYNAGPGNVIDRVPDIPITKQHVARVMLSLRGMRR